MEDFDGDGKTELLTSDGKDTVYTDEDEGFMHYTTGNFDGSRGDFQYANHSPWRFTKKQVVTVPTEEGQKKYNFDGDEKRVDILILPCPDEEAAKRDDLEMASAISQSGKVVTDYQVLPYKEMLPELAKRAEEFSTRFVSLEVFEQVWEPKYGNTWPHTISTTEVVGTGESLLVAKDREFRPGVSTKLYYFDFDMNDFSSYIKNSEVKKLG